MAANPDTKAYAVSKHYARSDPVEAFATAAAGAYRLRSPPPPPPPPRLIHRTQHEQTPTFAIIDYIVTSYITLVLAIHAHCSVRFASDQDFLV